MKEGALCNVVHNWRADTIAKLILSPQGTARGYLQMWVPFLEKHEHYRQLLWSGIQGQIDDDDSKKKMGDQLVRNLTEIVEKVRLNSRNRGETASKNKLNDTLWGRVDRVVAKGEVDRVMRIWTEVETAWRNMTDTDNTAELTPEMCSHIAVLGLAFVHSNEREGTD
jgi:hypothetical protein